jgi:hypothetical protein
VVLDFGSCSFDYPIVILAYYYAINQVKKVLFSQHFLFFWWLLCKQFSFLMKISGTHLAFDMNCQEPSLLVFQEAAILWIFPCFAASAMGQ